MFLLRVPLQSCWANMTSMSINFTFGIEQQCFCFPSCPLYIVAVYFSWHLLLLSISSPLKFLHFLNNNDDALPWRACMPMSCLFHVPVYNPLLQHEQIAAYDQHCHRVHASLLHDPVFHSLPPKCKSHSILLGFESCCAKASFVAQCCFLSESRWLPLLLFSWRRRLKSNHASWSMWLKWPMPVSIPRSLL